MTRAPHAFSRAVRVASFLLGLVIAAGCDQCGCDDVVIAPLDDLFPQCNLARECGVDDRENPRVYRYGHCAQSGCEEDSHCCPGTRCRLDVNACVPHQLDPEYQCDSDDDCPDPAQRCQEITLGARPPFLACAYDRCGGDDECGAGQSCFRAGDQGRGVCVETAPCGGGCPDGEVCDPVTSRCAALPANPENTILTASCLRGCGESELMVVRDPDTMTGDICCTVQCVCQALPPIIPSRYGKYSRVALVGNDEVLVSAYDSQFGDLVVAHYKTNGSLDRVEYVDGVPLAGAVVADPGGARRGIAEPGPDVGTHTSIVVDAQNRARVAYHDVDNRALKVAVQSDTGWSSYVVDSPTDDDAVVGQFTDIAIDAQSGTIFISYSVREVTGAPGINGRATGVKIARSNSPTPAAATDWSLLFVDARPTFDPCDGTCQAAQQCVLEGGAAVCANEASGCTDCSSSQFCTSIGAATECRVSAVPPTVIDFPKARGLYTAVTTSGSEAWVAHYDSIDGDLRVGHLNSGGGASATVLDGDGADGHRGGDAGRFPAITKLGDDLLVVYEDFTRHEVRAWQGADPAAAGAFTVVDGGKVVGEPGKKLVGAGANVALDDGGEPVVVYQDATGNNLKLARRASGAWTPEELMTEGAHGFYSDIATRGGTAFIVSVMAELDERGREQSRAALLVRALP